MSSSLSAFDRDQNIKKLESEFFDLAIIGGGITGAGVARDAASRGMKVALVEAADYASGTSSRSSKLIHGGIRYLENLEFHLVFEALSERKILFEIAPHLVHPLRFVLPLYKGGRVGMFKMGLGMWLYDALALFEAPEMHERLTAAELAHQVPTLRARDLLGGYRYSDAYMDDDRLVFETLRSACQYDCIAANYVSAEDVEVASNTKKVTALVCRDKLSGKSFSIRARYVVSTVGPWTDRVGAKLLKTWKRKLRPSKGVHLTFPRSKLPISDAVVMAAEKRIVFAIPRMEMVIVGTTDTDFAEDPSQVTTQRADVDYLLNVVADYFPGAQLQESDVLASYAGVRPLIDDGASTESKTSREHMIFHDPLGVTFVAGGKYTTYRHMAEQTVKQILSFFSVEDQVRFGLGKSQTLLPLNPLATVEGIARMRIREEDLSREHFLPVPWIRFLIERHGEEAEILLRSKKDLPVFGRTPEETVWLLEAWHAMRNTQSLSLSDFYLRRTPLFLSRADHGFGFLPLLRELFSELKPSTQGDDWMQAETHIRSELAWRRGNSELLLY